MPYYLSQNTRLCILDTSKCFKYSNQEIIKKAEEFFELYYHSPPNEWDRSYPFLGIGFSMGKYNSHISGFTKLALGKRVDRYEIKIIDMRELFEGTHIKNKYKPIDLSKHSVFKKRKDDI